MKSSVSSHLKRRFALAARVLSIIAMTMLSSYCTGQESQTPIQELSEDEQYLINAYARLVEASDLHSLTPLKSDSLFALLDSTIDTTRVANTIRALDSDPDRWLLVFRGIERDLKESSQGQKSEETR